MPSFSRGLEKALHQAMNLARERAHEFATLEHLLLALTDDRDTISVLAGCDVDVEARWRRLHGSPVHDRPVDGSRSAVWTVRGAARQGTNG